MKIQKKRNHQTIDTNHILTLEKALVNLMTQQAMILLRNHDYIVSQPINHKSNTSITSKQNYVDLMTRHRIKDICNIDNAMSLEKLVLLEEANAIYIELLGQQALNAHIAISMNSNKS